VSVVTSSSFRLSVLGVPALVDEAGQTPAALGWGKPLALLAYLAIRTEVRRDEIVDLLWRGVAEDKARNAFRQALHRLRSALGDELIPHDRDRLRLAASGRLAIDVVEFEQDMAAGRVESAIALYAGDFLDGAELGEPPFDHWVEQERTRLRSRFQQLLQDAVQRSSADGRWLDAIAGAQRLHRLAPFDVDAAKLAATTLLAGGRKSEALALLRQFAERTNAELGIPVHPEIQALLERVARETSDWDQSIHFEGQWGGKTAPLPFVGRQAELSQLIALWRSVREDAGAVALIEGDAGIGKTRLMQEFAGHVRALGTTLVLHGRERAAGAQVPFGIFGEALRPLVHAPGVAGASAHLLAEAARLLPEMRDTLNLPAVSAVEDEASRFRFFEGIAALVDAAAFEQPMLIVLEELQHLPPSSLDLLSYLLPRLASAQVMFALTLRPAEAPSAVLSRVHALVELGSPVTPDSRARSFVLNPLSSEEALNAIREPARIAGLSAASVDRIAAQSLGNPFRLEQGVRGATLGLDVPTLPVPMRDVLLERIQRLSSTHRRVFLVLALFGRPVSAALASSAAHVSESACHQAIRALDQQGLLDGVDSDSLHASEVAASAAIEMSGASRAFLSAWIAEALASEPEAENAELARFYAAAGNSARAFTYARRAAFDALRAGARAEAMQFFALARTHAESAQDRADVEAALETIGSGRLRLTGPSADAPAVPPSGGQAQPADATATSFRSEPAHRWERLFPHWRTLFGAAVATLLVSATVLATRFGDTGATLPAPDTLIVSEGVPGGPRWQRLAIGGPGSDFVVGPRMAVASSDSAWTDSFPRHWTHHVPGPRGLRVALSRVTAAGTDLVVIGRDRRDSLLILTGQRELVPLGWSPDGRWLLTTASASEGRFDAALSAIRVEDRIVLPIDSTRGHSVTEAVWSPDGSHIGWVARVGAERQQEVFVSRADGSEVRNVSRDASEDYHIAWSPSGEMLAFTSMRDGNAELYAADLAENRLWRLTLNNAHDDGAAFSADGRTIAFESTRRGLPSVYVMPALGGTARLIGGGGPLEFVAWRAKRRSYLDYLRISHDADLLVGDSGTVYLRGFDADGDSIPVSTVEWRVIDTGLVRLGGEDSSAWEPRRRMVGLRDGIARIVGTVGRWRSDTAFVRVGTSSVTLLSAAFSGGRREWMPLGVPAPEIDRTAGGGLILRAGREWDSGVLSRGTLPLAPGLTIEASFIAPWTSPPEASTQVSLSLVAPEERAAIDSIAPQFLRLASITWKGDAGRFAFAVGKDVFTEPVAPVPIPERRLRLVVEPDSTVSFMIDDKRRWRSTLRLTAPRAGSRLQVWISGRGTGSQVRVSSVSAALAATDSLRRARR